MVTKEDVMRVLKNVKDPEIGASIVNLGMVRAVEVQGSTVHVEIALTIPNCPLRDAIKDDVIKAVSGMDGVAKVEVQLSSMTDQERGKVSQTLTNRPTAEQNTVQQVELQIYHAHLQVKVILHYIHGMLIFLIH